MTRTITATRGIMDLNQLEKYGFEQFHTIRFSVPEDRLEKFEKAMSAARAGGLIQSWEKRDDGQIDVSMTQTRFAGHRPLFGQAHVHPAQFERLKRYIATADPLAEVTHEIPALQGYRTATLSDEFLNGFLAEMSIHPGRAPEGAGFAARVQPTPREPQR